MNDNDDGRVYVGVGAAGAEDAVQAMYPQPFLSELSFRLQQKLVGKYKASGKSEIVGELEILGLLYMYQVFILGDGVTKIGNRIMQEVVQDAIGLLYADEKG